MPPNRLVVALVLAAACADRGSHDGTGSTSASTDRGGGSSAAVPSAAAAPVAGGGGGEKPACPATGLWAQCSVMERLERAGLAPRRDSAAIRVEPLTQSGMRLTVGRSELDIFLYADAAARERDEKRLDKGEFVDAAVTPSFRREPTLIRSANLLAILRSISDRQRERVSDVLTAGPPQPAAAVPVPGTRARP